MKRSRVNPVSKKRSALNVTRRAFVLEILQERIFCQAQIPRLCANYASDVHEIKTRARGGSITDPDNVLALCRPCHTFITDNPAFASENGFIVHAWSGEADYIAAERARVAFLKGSDNFGAY